MLVRGYKNTFAKNIYYSYFENLRTNVMQCYMIFTIFVVFIMRIYHKKCEIWLLQIECDARIYQLTGQRKMRFCNPEKQFFNCRSVFCVTKIIWLNIHIFLLPNLSGKLFNLCRVHSLCWSVICCLWSIR